MYSEKKHIEILKNTHRCNAKIFINRIFQDFIEFNGDRLSDNDLSIIGGIASLNGIPVTVIGQLRGLSIDEQIKYNFSMTKPSGFRKAQRLMLQAEKFKRPVVLFVDTIGADPRVSAEEHGQVTAIANIMSTAMVLETPIITVLIGNGYSGGAMAFGIADRVVALEFAVLSVISPRAYAEIVWKDDSKDIEAASFMRIKINKKTREYKVIDHIIPETHDNMFLSTDQISENLKEYLEKEVKYLRTINSRLLLKLRRKKYSTI